MHLVGNLRVLIKIERAQWVSSALSLTLTSLTSAQERCLTIKFIWFVYIARLSHRGGRGYFTRSNDFYLPSRRLYRKGEGIGTHMVRTLSLTSWNCSGLSIIEKVWKLQHQISKEEHQMLGKWFKDIGKESQQWYKYQQARRLNVQ